METQICTKCHTEKSIQDYHRQGDKHKRICKSCISADGKARYASTGRTRITQTVRGKRIHFPENWDNIKRVLEAKSKRFAAETGDNMLADDLLSAMIEVVLLKSKEDRNMSYLLRCADWEAAQFIQKSRTYNFHVDTVEPENLTTAKTVEDEVVQHEISDELKAVIAQLSPKYQKIVSLLSLGYSQAEIAKKLNVRPATVNFHLAKIRKNMVALGVFPA